MSRVAGVGVGNHRRGAKKCLSIPPGGLKALPAFQEPSDGGVARNLGALAAIESEVDLHDFARRCTWIVAARHLKDFVRVINFDKLS
jgi:hypothetical protein